MNSEMAYLVGMILGNGEIQRNHNETTITIEIPHKNLTDDEGLEIDVYVRSSLLDITRVLEPLIGHSIPVTTTKSATKISFTMPNSEYTIREILRFIGNGLHHSSMRMNDELFNITTDEKKELMRGIADVTGYIRRSNRAFKQHEHRVYIEVPGNWGLTIDIANMLKSLDIPIQNINFGHPNFRDPQMKDYRKGKVYSWKKEHQIKVWANEFLPIGFNIVHKQRALERYATELETYDDRTKTHRFYWETTRKRQRKPIHPMENDASLPDTIRGIHFESWTDLAEVLGYGE